MEYIASFSVSVLALAGQPAKATPFSFSIPNFIIISSAIHIHEQEWPHLNLADV